VQQAVGLLLHGPDDPGVPLPNVEDADAACEVEVAAPIRVDDAGAFSAHGDDRMVLQVRSRDVALLEGEKLLGLTGRRVDDNAWLPFIPS
jgi:hypothetical protein